MILALIELVRAASAFVLAKARGFVNPCPPHDFMHGWEFCEKCGKTREELAE